MARSFASGLVWGFVVVGAGLALISQLAPPPKSVTSGVGAEAPLSSATPAMSGDTSGQDATKPVVAEGATAVRSDTAGAAATMPAAAPPVAQTTETAKPATDVVTGADTSSAPAPQADGVKQTPASANGGSASQVATDTAPKPATEPAAVAVAPSTVEADSGAKAAPGKAAASDGAAVADEATVDTTGGTTAGASVSGAAEPGQASGTDAAAPADGSISAAADPAATTTANAVAEAGAAAAAQPEVPDTAGAVAESAAPDLPPPPEAPAVAEAAPALSSLDAALTAPLPDQTPPVQIPAPDPIGAKDALLVPSQGAGLTEPTRLPQIATADDPGLAPAPLPAVTAPDTADTAPDAPQALAPRVITPDVPKLPGVKPLDSTLPTVLKPSVPGVETNALPQIGDAPKQEAVVSGAEADKPIVRYARRFDMQAGKPLFVILLHDVGAAGMSREDLAKLPFPVTFVVDPLATDAKAAQKAFRDAGQEVLMLANGIPQGATAGDLAQTFQTLQDILPEAVGVIDQETAGFQDNRALSGLVLPVIADQGRGLVTYDRGLNAANQIARRDGLPAAVIFRRLDGEGESQPVMRRYLDRAAFKAAQEGSVVVIGDTRADTVATILQWTIEGKASGVELAPVTAVMGRK